MRGAQRPLTAFFVVLFALTSNGRAEPDAASINRLIEQLGDGDFDKREAASRALAKIGEPALAALRKAMRDHDDAEVRGRASALVRRIETDLRGEIRHFRGERTGYWLNRIAFSPDGKQAVAAGGGVIWYDLDSGQVVRRVMELQFARRGFALSADGKFFVTGHQHDAVVRMGDLASGKEVRRFEGHRAGVNAVALSPDGKRLASGSDDSSLRLWDATTGKELRQLGGTVSVSSVAFSPDGKRVASGHCGLGDDFGVRLWDAESGKEVRSLKAHRLEVMAVLFTPDGKQLISAGMDGNVIVWEVESGKELRRMTHEGGVYSAAISPDGKRVLTAGYGDKTVRLWEVATGKERRRLDGHPSRVLGVAFSPDGKRALSSDADGTIFLWKMPER